MSESSNNPAGDRSGIAEAITTTLRQPSFLRVMLVLAATVVVLVGIRLGAPILNPIFFAVVLTLLVSPIYSWLLRRGLPAPLALVAMLVILIILFVGLSFILGASIGKFSERVGFYTTQLNGLVILIALLVGGQLLGIPGALLAIPVAEIIRIMVTELLAYRRTRQEARKPAVPSSPPEPTISG